MGTAGDRRRPRGGAGTVLAVAAVAVLALLASCTQDVDPPEARTRTNTPSAFSLVVNEDCDELVDRTREQLAAAVAPMRDEAVLREGDVAVDMPAEARSSEAGDALAATPPTTGFAEGAGASADSGGKVVAGTNVQEVGVDEGDLVKTDGRRIVTVVDGVLRVTVLDGSPAVDGVLDLRGAGASEMFLRGDEAVVIGSGGTYGPMDDVLRAVPAPRALPGTATGEDRAPGAVGRAGSGAAGGGTAEPVMPVEPVAPDEPVMNTTVPGSTSTSSTTSTTSTTSSTTSTTSTTTTTTVPPVTIPPQRFATGVTITRVDLSDATSPRIVESTEVEGSLVATRMVDGTVRVVVRTSPAVMERLWSSPDPLAAVEDVEIDDVLPRRTAPSGEVEALGTCSDVLTTPATDPDAPDSDGGDDTVDPVAPGSRSGLVPDGDRMSWSPPPEQVTVLTVREDLADLAPVTVQGSAETTYASTGALFVASTSWWSDGPATAVHRFDLAGDGGATYSGSGVVPGSLLDQYSMSERDGHLRIVTTTQAPAVGAREPAIAVEPAPGAEIRPAPAVPSTEGRLTVLSPDSDGTLREVGHVEDLGVGETVQSVRFLDDLAYVVTFRRTDPLYAVDLSDPTAPRVLGELKIPGFSEYLHPLGDGLLLGIGRDADEVTGMDRGFKASLFDVSDATNPRELDTVLRGDTYSTVSDDALAFSWDPVRRQAVVPITTTCGRTIDCARADWRSRNTALVLGVADGSLEERGEIAHGDGREWSSGIRRSVVVDDDLWTVSSMGLGRSSASSPTSVELLPY